jgi:hypothetical protein
MRLVDEAPRLNAIGKAPKEVARLVIKIGRKRLARCFNTALCLSIPCSLFGWQIQRSVFRSWLPNQSA